MPFSNIPKNAPGAATILTDESETSTEIPPVTTDKTESQTSTEPVPLIETKEWTQSVSGTIDNKIDSTLTLTIASDHDLKSAVQNEVYFPHTNIFMNAWTYIRGNFTGCNFSFSFDLYSFRTTPVGEEAQDASLQHAEKPVPDKDTLLTKPATTFHFIMNKIKMGQKHIAAGFEATMKSHLNPADRKESQRKCVHLVVWYVVVFYMFQYCSQVNVKSWKFCRNSQNHHKGVNACPARNLHTRDAELQEMTSMPPGTGGLVFSVVMCLALYLHPFCGFIVLVQMVLIYFFKFKATSWYGKLTEITSMESCIVACVLYLNEMYMQLVPGTVLQLATSCVMTAMYAIPIIFEAPPRLISRVGPFVNGMAPNPFWLAIEADSALGTWQAVMNEFNKTEEGIFLQFKTTEYLVYIMIVKYVLDAAVIAELCMVDVPSRITGCVIKLKVAMIFYFISNVVNIGPMLQLSPSTLSINSFMVVANVSIAAMVNPVVGEILKLLQKVPYIGCIVPMLFNDTQKVFTVTVYGNSMLDLFTMTSTASSGDIIHDLSVHFLVCCAIVVLAYVSRCCQILWQEHSKTLDLVTESFSSVMMHSHRPTLILASLVWTLIGVYVLCARQFAFFQKQLPVEQTNMHTKWPLVVVMVLCVDVAINLCWFCAFLIDTLYAIKSDLDKIKFSTVGFLRSHETGKESEKFDHVMIFQHTCHILPSLQCCVRTSFLDSSLKIIGFICDAKSLKLTEGLMSPAYLSHHIPSMYHEADGEQHIFLGNAAIAVLAHIHKERQQLDKDAQTKIPAKRKLVPAAKAVLPPSVATASSPAAAVHAPPGEIHTTNGKDVFLLQPQHSKVLSWIASIGKTAKTSVPITPIPVVSASHQRPSPKILDRSKEAHASPSKRGIGIVNPKDTWTPQSEISFDEFVNNKVYTQSETPESIEMYQKQMQAKMKKRNAKTCGLSPYLVYGVAFSYFLMILGNLWAYSHQSRKLPNVS